MNAITPLQRWTRDDWVIPCSLRDAAGTAIDLTGSTIVGELWLAGYATFQPLTVGNGGIVRVSDGAGQFRVVASRLLTARARPGVAAGDPSDSTRILLARIDTAGFRQTLGIVVVDVFDAADTRFIDQVPAVALVSQSTTLQLVVAASQGPAGPSNIAAAQISDGGALGRGLLKADDAAAARGLLGVTATLRAAVADTNYPARDADTYIGYTALTAPRTVTLPAAAAYLSGQPLWIADETGACSTDRPIIVTAAGSDTVAGQPNIVMASPYQKLALHSNGTNLWTI